MIWIKRVIFTLIASTVRTL